MNITAVFKVSVRGPLSQYNNYLGHFSKSPSLKWGPWKKLNISICDNNIEGVIYVGMCNFSAILIMNLFTSKQRAEIVTFDLENNRSIVLSHG